MTDYMVASLKKFIKEESMARIENSGARIWKETYKEANQKIKPIITVVFSRYQADNTTETEMGKAGYVLAIPAYWIDIDVELTLIYISSMVDSYLSNYFNYDPNSGSSSGSGGGTRPPCPVHPPRPTPPPGPPVIPPVHPDKPPHVPCVPPPPVYNPPPPQDIPNVLGPADDPNTMYPGDVAKVIGPEDFVYMSPINPDEVEH